MLALGIDIGGSGIKGAVVDTECGSLVSDRMRVPTPRDLSPEALAGILHNLFSDLDWKKGPVGIGFPGVIRGNTIFTAANLDKRLVGLNLEEVLDGLGSAPVRVLNDADAAGFAEMEFGAGLPYRKQGTVLLLTVGTGIGTVMFVDGVLVPNLELGHVEFNGAEAEHLVSERTRKHEDLSWKRWAKRFSGYLEYLERLLNPDVIILGGGGVSKVGKFEKHLSIQTPWVMANNGNRAGIIGAALAAASRAG